ncbi:PEP/pyruvate-binding domain-containing protein, partial [Nonomuraea sp. NPDC055795]
MAVTDTRTVVTLRELTARDAERAGNKAVNLAAMLGRGFSVPDGFVVTTPAYASACAETAALLLDGASSAEEVARSVRAAILATEPPEALARAVVRAYRAMGEDIGVAVRSSSPSEDLAEASFAGQYDTFLHVSGGDEVLAAIKRCWASLWSDRARADPSGDPPAEPARADPSGDPPAQPARADP